ncbi:hypothetical protein F5Y09DRAFT_336697 [Xylaria sp. FL1042]|nr:hypothetical protein F5Y09DRAFT_336697 [Xylaria sp. FL1042]
MTSKTEYGMDGHFPVPRHDDLVSPVELALTSTECGSTIVRNPQPPRVKVSATGR